MREYRLLTSNFRAPRNMNRRHGRCLADALPASLATLTAEIEADVAELVPSPEPPPKPAAHPRLNEPTPPTGAIFQPSRTGLVAIDFGGGGNGSSLRRGPATAWSKPATISRKLAAIAVYHHSAGYRIRLSMTSCGRSSGEPGVNSALPKAKVQRSASRDSRA